MARIPLHSVRRLTIAEISEMWANEQRRPPRSVFERELRLAVLNLPRLQRGGPTVDPDIPDAELPPTDTLVSPEFLMQFCEKNQWPPPRFWPQLHQTEQPRRPGRPSVMPAIVQELERRASAGQLGSTLASEARALRQWAHSNGPIPTVASIQNRIRSRYRELKPASNTINSAPI